MEENYINGSDLLLKVAGKPVGHCTSHKLTFNTESKERAVKPVATKSKSAGKFKDKSVTGLSISISFEGLRFYNETENGFEQISASWGAGEPVDVEAFRREEDSSPYVKGSFVIDSIEENSPAAEDATYSGSLSNNGEPEVYPGKPAGGA